MIYRIIGPPGTGKTTTIAKNVEKAVEKYGLRGVVVCSLTKASAATAAKRVILPRTQVGTLHSLIYHEMGAPTIAETRIKDWNDAHPGLALEDDKTSIDEPQQERFFSDSPAMQLLSQANILRARMVPRDAWPVSVAGFSDKWEAWKADCGYIDFTDMLEHALEHIDEAPHRPRVFFVDEGQDFSALEAAIILKWAHKAFDTIIVGDPYQCQPPGTMIATPNGPKPIETLQNGDHVLSFDRRHSVILGYWRKTYPAQVANRPYDGFLYTVSTGSHASRYTENHWSLAQWDNTTKWNVVYLMRQKERWRVGWCQLFDKQNTLHLKARARLEKADAVWILSAHRSKAEASIQESIIATQYGLPTITFRGFDTQARGYYTAENIDRFFASLDADEQAIRAKTCLRDHHRHSDFPFYDISMLHQKAGKRTSLILRACNLLPEVMKVPVQISRRSVQWMPIKDIHTSPYTGPVYSLDVMPHHTYIADGIATHNCLFAFRGSDPIDAFPIDADCRILKQSYRIPQAVYERAMAWVQAMPGFRDIEYIPRRQTYPDGPFVQGECTHINLAWKDPERITTLFDSLPDDETLMIQTSCAYMLDPVLARLRESGIPYWNDNRLRAGRWNPLRTGKGTALHERLLAFLRPWASVWGERAAFWTPAELASWSAPLIAKQIWQHGAKSKVEELGKREGLTQADTAQAISAWMLEGAIDTLPTHTEPIRKAMQWWQEKLMVKYQPRMEYFANILQRDPTALGRRPRVIVGTIHSLKGAEADNVVLFPDISQSGYTEWMNPQSKASVYRQFYVGMTRARTRLYIGSNCNMGVPL